MKNDNLNIFRIFCVLVILMPQVHSHMAGPSHATRALEPRTLQLNGHKKTYTLDPLPRQGSRSYVYQVVGGWGRRKVPAVAKMFLPHRNDAGGIVDEIAFAKLAMQWIADGKDSTGNEWLVLTDLKSPEISGEEMYNLIDIIHNLRKKSYCEYAMEVAPQLAKAAAEKKFDQGLAFYDVSELKNIVFNRSMTKADFVDMGGAMRSAQVLSYQTKDAFLDEVVSMVASAIENDPRLETSLLEKICL